MFSHLRPARRLCLEETFPRWPLSCRALSGAEAVNALRPFYFAVHPDFFGQHPTEREVNENSLKRLSVYLENLQKPGLKSLKPTQLTFHVRETDQNSSDGQEPVNTCGFRVVSFTLHTRDLLSTVLHVLNSCSLSVEHIQNVSSNVQPPEQAKRRPDRPIKWDKTYYTFTGFKDPEGDLQQASRLETTLTSWLDNNGESAVKRLESSLPLRKELDRLKEGLSHQLQLTDIRWQRGWGVAHRCSQLHSLSRLTQQNMETLKNAKGCTIIFADRSGMSAVGHVMLGTMDVHHHWTTLFERLPHYLDLQRRLALLEEQISQLLGGIQVVCTEDLQPALTLEEHYSLLDAFRGRLLRHRRPVHPRSLRGLQMVLDRNTVFQELCSLHTLFLSRLPTVRKTKTQVVGVVSASLRRRPNFSDRCAPSLHELGHFNIPVLCDPASLQGFILAKAQEARESLRRKEELKAIEKELMRASTEHFSLAKFYKEPSVSSKQMAACCKRLLERSLPCLQGMRLCVSHFYSVTQDGDLCIPWNWKDGGAMK